MEHIFISTNFLQEDFAEILEKGMVHGVYGTSGWGLPRHVTQEIYTAVRLQNKNNQEIFFHQREE